MAGCRPFGFMTYKENLPMAHTKGERDKRDNRDRGERREDKSERIGSRRGPLQGPPPYGGSRFAPGGDGPSTPRDQTSREHCKPDHGTMPKGSPSDTPRPRG